MNARYERSMSAAANKLGTCRSPFTSPKAMPHSFHIHPAKVTFGATLSVNPMQEVQPFNFPGVSDPWISTPLHACRCYPAKLNRQHGSADGGVMRPDGDIGLTRTCRWRGHCLLTARVIGEVPESSPCQVALVDFVIRRSAGAS